MPLYITRMLVLFLSAIISTAHAANKIVTANGHQFAVGQRIFHETENAPGTIASFSPSSRTGLGYEDYYIDIRLDDGRFLTSDHHDLVSTKSHCDNCDIKIGDVIAFHDSNGETGETTFLKGTVVEIFRNGVAIVETPHGRRQTALEPHSIRRATLAISFCESLASTSPEKPNSDL